MTVIEKNCPTCGDPIAPSKDAAQFNRNLALHNRAKHGYKSPNFQRNKDYKERVAGHSNSPLHWTQRPENRAKLAANQRKAWEARRANSPTAATMSRIADGRENRDARAKRLAYQKKWREENPRGKRAQQTQTSEVVACRLTECPACGTRFYMAKGTA